VQSKRRQLVVGAGVAAGAAAAAAALGQRVGEPVATAKAAPGTTGGEGYRLTDHVLRYYQTTRS
jgi:phosphodiesterase/alkaline phosphatase D-like protein